MSEEKFVIRLEYPQGGSAGFVCLRSGNGLYTSVDIDLAYSARFHAIQSTARRVEKRWRGFKAVVIAERDARALKAS